jgi:hypothetical protein
MAGLFIAGAIWSTMLSGALANDLRQGSAVRHRTPEPAAADHQSVDTAAVVPSGTADMRIYINPATGKIEAPPPNMTFPALSQSGQNAMSTSHDGLEEEPSAVPGGGFKLDLKGRFRSPLITTKDSTGKLTLKHLHAAPLPEAK